MNSKLISTATCAAAWLFVTGCGVMVPTPAADTNAAAMNEPISYYGDVELFDKKTSPLMVMITAPVTPEDAAWSETLKNVLNKSDVKCVLPGTPCDIQLSVRSEYQELTPAPQCRMNHILKISIAAANGTKLLPQWEHKTEGMQTYPNAADAKNGLAPYIKQSIAVWERDNFSNGAGAVLKAYVLRFKMSRKLIELDPVRFERDLRAVLNKLRRTNGVVNVRLIEANRDTKIASFRVLYRKDLYSNK